MDDSTDWKHFILSCKVLMNLTDGLSYQSRNVEHTAAQALSASSCCLLFLLMLEDIVDAHIQPFTIVFSLHSFIISLFTSFFYPASVSTLIPSLILISTPLLLSIRLSISPSALFLLFHHLIYPFLSSPKSS